MTEPVVQKTRRKADAFEKEASAFARAGQSAKGSTIPQI
jgi:hypothetical protein